MSETKKIQDVVYDLPEEMQDSKFVGVGDIVISRTAANRYIVGRVVKMDKSNRPFYVREIGTTTDIWCSNARLFKPKSEKIEEVEKLPEAIEINKIAKKSKGNKTTYVYPSNQKSYQQGNIKVKGKAKTFKHHRKGFRASLCEDLKTALDSLHICP